MMGPPRFELRSDAPHAPRIPLPHGPACEREGAARIKPFGSRRGGIFTQARERERMALQNNLHRLTAFFAVATLPAGILAGLFLGLQAAVVVFVIGWLLLVPGTAVLFPPTMITGPGTAEGVDEMVRSEIRQSLNGDRSESESFDPVEELRGRYARGEIDEQELERGLDALLETEGVDADDEAEIQKTIDRLDRGETDLGAGDGEPDQLGEDEESDLLTEDS